MHYTSEDIGKMIRLTRVGIGLTQESLAMAAGTGLRFIIDLEKGKPTCELAKSLAVLNTLGIKINFSSPVADVNRRYSNDEWQDSSWRES